MSASQVPTQRLAALDWLRGAAALAVVMFHYFHASVRDGWVQGDPQPFLYALAGYGYVGVHLFFVISGYVIMMTAQNATVRQFVASRVSRLAPALWVCVTLTTLVELSVPTSPIKPESLWQFLANLTLVPGLFGQKYIDGAYWSLAVEINFYFWVALAIATGQIRRIETWLLFWLALSFANFLRPMYTVQVLTSAQWAPLFSAGAFFFLVRQSGWTMRRRLAIAISVALACMYLWRENGPVADVGQLFRLESSPNHLVIEAILLSFFGFFFLMIRGNLPIATSNWSKLGGRLTYPLYLVHQHIGYALFSLAAATGVTASLGLTWVGMGLIAVALVLAWGVNAGVEERWASRLRKWIAGDRGSMARAQV